MTKKERIRAAINGGEIDQFPYSMWSHLPGIDHDPVPLAEQTYEFYKKYDIDFVKTMNNGMYPIEDYGCEVDYSDIPKGGMAHISSTPIHEVQDWEKITETTCNLVREVLKTGADGIFFASQMSCYDTMTDKEYLEFGKPYDLKVLEAASEGWFNVLHAHGENQMSDGRNEAHGYHELPKERDSQPDLQLFQAQLRPPGEGNDRGQMESKIVSGKSVWPPR